MNEEDAVSKLSDALREGGALAEPNEKKPNTEATAAVPALRENPAGTALALPADVGDALAVLDERGLGGDLGLMGINDADRQLGAQMPRMQIVQKTSQVKDAAGASCGVPGHLVHAITQEQRAALACTLLAQKFSRQYLGAYDGEGLKVVCASSDGRVSDWEPERSSAPSSMPALGTACATCPHAQWRRGARGPEPPRCSELFTLLLWLHETEEPVVFFVRRTGVRPWRAATQQIKMAGFRARGKTPGADKIPPNLLVSFVLAAEHVERAGMDWWEPRFRGFEPAPPSSLPGIIQCTAQLAPQFAGLRSEDLEEAGDVFDEASADEQRRAPSPQDRDGGAEAFGGSDDLEIPF